MTRRHSREAGMTLIELLLAVTLFGAISASMGMVLRVAFTSMSKIDAKVDQNRRVIATQKAIDQILNGLIPVVTPCGGQPMGFQGRPDVMRFVSSFSLTEGSRGRPQIIELFMGANPEGGVRLLLNERPFLGKQSLSIACAAPPAATANSFILADRLSRCRFGYRRIDQEQGSEQWMIGWSFPEWPSGIQIEMAPLKNEANRILPTTVFAPILVKDLNFDAGQI